LRFLRREGLIAPDEIATDEDYVPLDFTKLNNRELGAVHSRYAVRHSHALFVLARVSAERAMLERDRRMAEAQFRAEHKDNYSTKWELDDAMLVDEALKQYGDRVSELEIRVHLVEGVAEGYDRLARAASREISRRISEQAPRD